MITSNKNTTQSPLSGLGATGAQVLKFIAASRIYIKAPESMSICYPPLIKSAGTTPSGWIDLGTLEGKVKVGVQKKVKEVKTGIDGYFRGSYSDEKVGLIEFNLCQLDDFIIQQITGLTPLQVQATIAAGYAIGSEELNPVALLVTVQNKLDSKEIQFYNPAALLNFGFESQGDEMDMHVTGYLPFFSTAAQPNVATMLSMTIFSGVDGKHLSDIGDVPLSSLGDITLDSIV